MSEFGEIIREADRRRLADLSDQELLREAMSELRQKSGELNKLGLPEIERDGERLVPIVGSYDLPRIPSFSVEQAGEILQVHHKFQTPAQAGAVYIGLKDERGRAALYSYRDQISIPQRTITLGLAETLDGILVNNGMSRIPDTSNIYGRSSLSVRPNASTAVEIDLPEKPPKAEGGMPMATVRLLGSLTVRGDDVYRLEADALHSASMGEWRDVSIEEPLEFGTRQFQPEPIKTMEVLGSCLIALGEGEYSKLDTADRERALAAADKYSPTDAAVDIALPYGRTSVYIPPIKPDSSLYREIVQAMPNWKDVTKDFLKANRSYFKTTVETMGSDEVVRRLIEQVVLERRGDWQEVVTGHREVVGALPRVLPKDLLRQLMK